MKKLFFIIDDGDSTVTMELDGCMSWINGYGLKEGNDEDVQFILTPTWMTQEEFENLPEAEL